MNNKILLLSLIAIIFTAFNSNAQTNFEFIANAPVSDGSNDIWGYHAPNGDEYAIMGRNSGVSIFDIREPANPVEVAFLPGANSGWRDIKTWGEYAFVTNESNNGLMIIDLTDLPNGATSTDWTGADGINFTSAHNIFMDENGVGYIVGANYGVGGAIMIDCDIENPMEPVILGVYNTRYIHDCYVRDNIMYSCEGNDGIFSIVDVTDKQNPQVLGTSGTYGYTHNSWLSDDGETLFTTDETSGTWVVAWDVTDPTDIQELDRWQSSPGSGVIPHNTFVVNNFLVTSYYLDGVTMTDISNPSAMVEVGNYDTSAQSGNGFNGVWGVYPYFESGLVVASDMQNGLYVLQPTYQAAAFLNGTVTDASNANPINDVLVELLNTGNEYNTDIAGNFSAGLGIGGTFDVKFSKYGYDTHIEQGVEFIGGQTVNLNIELIPQTPFTVTGKVKSLTDGSNLSFSGVTITTDGLESDIITDAGGNFTLDPAFEGSYNFIVSSWGYVTHEFQNVYVSATNDLVVLELNPGYYDDFATDLGWTSNNTAPSGHWERANSAPQSFGGDLFTPDGDLSGDFGDKCYVTGNDGFYDLLIGGTNTLTSPVFDLSDYTDPYLNYSTWFVNFAYQGVANDFAYYEVSNGTETVTLETFNGPADSNSDWYTRSWKLTDYIDLTDNMQFSLIGDQTSPGFYVFVESALDKWSIVDSSDVAFNSEVNDDLIENVIPGSTANVINTADNDVLTCTPLYTIDSYDAAVFSNVSIDDNGALEFDVNSTAAAGSYSIDYSLSCGFASFTSSSVVEVIAVVGIDIINTDDLFTIYPNPTKDEIGIDTEIEKEELIIKVFNSLGQQVINEKISDGKVNVSHLNTGIYLVDLLKDGEQLGTQKLIIE